MRTPVNLILIALVVLTLVVLTPASQAQPQQVNYTTVDGRLAAEIVRFADDSTGQQMILTRGMPRKGSFNPYSVVTISEVGQ